MHCDLLSYLEIATQRTPYDPVVHCSIPQLKQGGVKLQVLAVFTRTGLDSVQSGQKQIEIYKNLPNNYPIDFCFYKPEENPSHSLPVSILMSIENASGLWSEDEPFTEGLKRFKSLIQSNAKPLYLGLTWHEENRFGGGNAAKIGLKEEGKHLLDELDNQNIAIDFSHTSDALADGILDYLEYKNLSIPILASHSNARSVRNHPRNLPDTLAKEIFKREGIIGLNFYKGFVGTRIDDFVRHIAHWLELGGEKNICLGADFFYEADVSKATLKKVELAYFPELQNAACYPYLLSLFKQELGFSYVQLNALAWQNAKKFISKVLS